MGHIYFEEVQRFSQLRWLWLVSAAVFITSIVVTLTADISEHEYANPILALTISVGAWIPIFMLFAFGKLHIKIDQDGLHYRFPPSIWKWRTITIGAIQSADVRRKETLYEKIGCGYRRSLIRNTIFMNITGTQMLHVQLMKGRRMTIGVSNPETVQWAIDRLLEKKES